MACGGRSLARKDLSEDGFSLYLRPGFWRSGIPGSEAAERKGRRKDRGGEADNASCEAWLWRDSGDRICGSIASACLREKARRPSGSEYNDGPQKIARSRSVFKRRGAR